MTICKNMNISNVIIQTVDVAGLTVSSPGYHVLVGIYNIIFPIER